MDWSARVKRISLPRRGLVLVPMLGCALLAPEAASQTLAQAGERAAAEVDDRTAESATYLVAARDLARDEVLTAADIERVALPEGEAGPQDGPATLVGWRTRRVIAQGEPLRPPGVSPPDLVRAGETVHAVYQGRSVVLRIAGTAAGSAAMGERVLVRVDARRRLEGVVIGPALVQIDSK